MAKHAGGRPTLFCEEFCEQATKLCKLGATNDELAEFFDVATSTIGKWISEISQFSDAVRAGRQIADAEVASKLFHRATGYSHEAVKIFQHEGGIIEAPYVEHYPPDTGAAKLWLINRRPDLWRDRVTQEVTGKDGAPLIPEVSDTELARRIALVLTKGAMSAETTDG